MATVRTYGSSALNVQAVPQRDRRRANSPTPQEQRWLEEQRRREQQRRRMEAQRREAQRVLAQQRLARKEAAKKVAILVYVCTLFAVLSFVILGYANIANIQTKNNALSKQMDTYNAQIADLQLQLSQKTDLQTIRQQAQERLNMGYPKAFQVLEINLNKNTTATATGGNAANQSGGTGLDSNAD